MRSPAYTRQRLDDNIELIDNMLWIFRSGPVHLVISGPGGVEDQGERQTKDKAGFDKSKYYPPIMKLFLRKSFYWPNPSI